MTTSKKLKKRVRARMEETGESYTAALAGLKKISAAAEEPTRVRGHVTTIDGPGVTGVIANVEATGPGAGEAVAAFFGPLVGATFGADVDAALARRKGGGKP